MDSYYPGDGESDNEGDETMPEGAAPEQASDDDGEKGEDGAATALVPKTLLGGKDCQPGDEVTMKIVHDYGDEVELAYVGEDKSESDPGAPEMAGAMDRMGAMGS